MTTRKVLISVCFLLLSGCSSQFAYNNLDWLIHWYLDDYIDLNRSQKKLFDEHFANWHQWHREHELQVYNTHLSELRALITGDEASVQDISMHFERARAHWQRLRAQLAPDIAILASEVSDEQIAQLFAELEEKNVDDENERRDLQTEELVEVLQERLEKQIVEYIGKLTAAQKERVSVAARQLKPNKLEWIKYKRRVQSAAREILEYRNNSATFETEFRALLLNPEEYQHEAYRIKQEHNRLVYAELCHDILLILSEKQKRRLLRKIDRFIEDFSELSERQAD